MDHQEQNGQTPEQKKPDNTNRRWKRRPVKPYMGDEFFVLPPDMSDDEAILHTVPTEKETPAEDGTTPDNVVPLEDLAARHQADVELAEELAGTRVMGEEEPEEEAEEEPVGSTRLVETVPVKSRSRTRAKKPVDEVEGQLKLDDWEEPPMLDEDWQERLRRTRQEQIEDFERRREKAGGLKLSGEEEHNDPVEEQPEPEQEPEDKEEELEDYSSYMETAAVRSELAYRQRLGWITLAATALPELLLIWLAFVSHMFHNVTVLHIILTIILMAIVMVANYRAIISGWKNLFRLAADADSPVAVASTMTLIHTVVQLFNVREMASSDTAPLLLPAVAGLGLLLNAAGRQWRVCRIRNNFRLASYEGEKLAACRIDNPQEAMEIGRPAVAMGVPEVCYFKQARFLTGFLRHSYTEDVGDEQMRLYVPCSIGVSLVLGVIAYFCFGSVFTALSAFTAALCVSAPMGMLTAVNFPLWRVSNRLIKQGTMLSGWDAVEEFGGADALTVDAMQLFPENSVLLHGIKTFAGTPIDRAILDAASVAIMAGGPLASVFRRVIEDENILQPVDSLVYEQDMGVSGWVDGRRVLVGNRRLLENHGVDVPSHDYELRYTTGDRQLVYLSTAGELSAMFVVSYLADDEIEQSLKTLTKEGITLLIRTCDPNVTEELVCNAYNLDRYYVEVLDATAGRLYVRLQSEEYADREALVGSNGWVQGMAQAIAYCRRLRKSGRLAVAAQLIGCILGLALTAFATFYNGTPFSAFHTVGYILVVTIVSWLLPLIKKV